MSKWTPLPEPPEVYISNSGIYRVIYAATQQRIIFINIFLFHQMQQSMQLLQETQQ